MSEIEDCVIVTGEEIVEITINRPDSLNALNREVLEILRDICSRLKTDPSVRVVVIGGAGGKAFVAGADINSMSKLSTKDLQDYIELGQEVMSAIEALPVPVIAAVQGFALGGGLELALACDIIVASKKARVGQPEVNLGIIPGFGGTQRLIQRCGVGIARYLTYTGEMIDGQAAKEFGVVDLVVEPEEFTDAVHNLASKIVTKAPLAVAGAKEVILQYAGEPLQVGLQREVQKFVQLFDTDDRKEGMSSFLEKRTPEFKGR